MLALGVRLTAPLGILGREMRAAAPRASVRKNRTFDAGAGGKVRFVGSAAAYDGPAAISAGIHGAPVKRDGVRSRYGAPPSAKCKPRRITAD